MLSTTAVLFLRALLCLLALVSTEAVAIDGNSRMGETLATSIAETVQQMKAAENRGLGDEAMLRQIVAKTLASKQEVLANPKVATVIAQANSLAAHRSIPEDAVCARNWSQPCPDGWELVGTDTCIAPTSYKGGCAQNQMFGASSQLAKFTFASKCQAPWPCSSSACALGHDYETCPKGWDSIGDGFCHYGGSESPKCASVLAFGDMQIAEKQEYAKDCEFEWGCRSSCERDFKAQCPEGWQKQSNLCVAPVSYAGTCSYSVDTSSMSEAQKQKFASACSVQFPCVGADTGVSHSAHREEAQNNGPVPPASNGGKVSLDHGSEAGLPQQWIKMPSGPLDTAAGIQL